jgi:hypothetical protein
LTPVLAWSPPDRCALRFLEEASSRLEDQEPALIKNSKELSKHVECAAGFKADFDFNAEWIAVFPLVSTSGASFKALSIKDDGKTLNLDVETRSYCGGARPGTSTETFLYRVPQRARALAIKLIPAEQPPCSPSVN